MGDLRLVCFPGEDLDYVEAEADVGKVEQAQPRHRAFSDLALFVIVDGIRGATALFIGPGFYLDKDEGIFSFVAAHEIDLTASRWYEVSVKNAEAVLAQMFCRELLAPATEDNVFSLWFFGELVPPVKKTGDGGESGHEFEARQGVLAHHSPCAGGIHTVDKRHR